MEVSSNFEHGNLGSERVKGFYRGVYFPWENGRVYSVNSGKVGLTPFDGRSGIL